MCDLPHSTVSSTQSICSSFTPPAASFSFSSRSAAYTERSLAGDLDEYAVGVTRHLGSPFEDVVEREFDTFSIRLFHEILLAVDDDIHEAVVVELLSGRHGDIRFSRGIHFDIVRVRALSGPVSDLPVRGTSP